MNKEIVTTSRFLEVARAPRTEAHKLHIKEALIGKKRPEIAENQTSTWRKVYPLAIRNGTLSEIAELIDTSSVNVRRLIQHPRTVMQLPDEYFSPENKKYRHAKGSVRAGKTRKGVLPTLSEVRSLRFAKNMIEAGMIENELSSWHGLIDLFAESGRNLPDNFNDQLRLELFYRARRELLLNNNSEIFVKYVNLGQAVDPRWFDRSMASEEDFITVNFASHGVYDGEDKLGLYRRRGNQKWRQYVESDEEGKVLFDNSVLSAKRKQFRDRH